MGVWGADVAGLEAVAADLDRYAESIEQARSNIEVQLSRTAWQGPSADQFRQQWRAIAMRDLDGFRTDCRQTAAELRRQARDQSAASAGGRGRGASAHRSSGQPVQTRPFPGGNERLALAPGLAMGIAQASAAAPLVLHAINRMYVGTEEQLAETAAHVVLAAVEHGMPLVPGGAPASSTVRAGAASLALVLTAVTAYHGAAHRRYEEDIGRGFTDAELTRRAIASGTMRVMVTVTASAVAAAKLGPFAGMVVGPGSDWAMEDSALGWALESGAADLATDPGEALGRAPEGFSMMWDATTELSGRGVDLAQGAYEGALRMTGEVLDDVGGRVSDAAAAFTRSIAPHPWWR